MNSEFLNIEPQLHPLLNQKELIENGYLHVEKSVFLQGEVALVGAKNAVLAIIAQWQQ